MIEFDPKINWATLIQLVAFVVGIGVVWFQLNKQRQLQKENHLIQARREIYREITDRMEQASPAGVSITLDLLVGLLEKAKNKRDETGIYRPPPMRVEGIVDDFKQVQSRLFGVTGTIEKYEIVSVNQPLFRRALVAKITELSDSFMPIIFLLPYLLISKDGINDPGNLLIPNEEERSDIQEKIDQFKEIASDIDGFLYDVQVEAQNVLLGALFERKLETRKPLDNSLLVLTSQDPQELSKVRAYVQLSERTDDEKT
jgi:hypothetical protein